MGFQGGQGETALDQVRKIVRAGNGGVVDKQIEEGRITMLLESSTAPQKLLDCFRQVGIASEQFTVEYKKRKAAVNEQLDELMEDQKKEVHRMEEDFKRQENLIQEDIDTLHKEMMNTNLSKEAVTKYYTDALARAVTKADGIDTMISA